MALGSMATMWVMVTVMRLVGKEEGKGKGSKGNGNDNVRMAGKEEGEGSKAMGLVTRMVGEWTATATKKAMVTATRVVGEQRQWQQRG